MKKMNSKKLSLLKTHFAHIEREANLSASDIATIGRLLSKLEHGLKTGDQKSVLKAIDMIAEVLLSVTA